jgi:eukaryotic-like serine/threonine-protein kinase
MALSPGIRLGPYQIVAPIGAGGMGEVYRALDMRLGRTVAVKVLLPHLADRADVRERFEREARTIANLNHPHICVLYDVGRQDGVDYLVMEHLEGETLAQRLRKGPLPLEDTLRYAAEIADALDKAHCKNVTHRDLKPGNIMLTKSGTKLLDFGLAKLKQDAAPAAVPMSQLPTLTSLPTAHSAIVGTLQYMAPEQLEGKQLDGRTDIFAFGAVLYEMATGKKAFEGETQASLISAIMSASPAPISAIQPMTPVALDRVVRKCLAKEPEKRWQTASDLSDELKWIAQDSSDHPRSAVPAEPAAPPKRQSRLATLSIAAGALVVVVAGIALWLRQSTPATPQQVSRFSINLAPGERLASTDFPQPAVVISPDGSRLVYAASQSGGVTQLYLRGINNLDAKAIPATEGANNPFFSPDGQWIGFFTGSAMKKVSVAGGVPVTICPVSGVTQPFGATWGTDDTIVFGARFSPGLLQVAAGGGTPVAATTPNKQAGETGHAWPSFLPDAKALLYTVDTATGSRIVVRVPATGEQRDLGLAGGERPNYASSGYLVYSQEGTLMAARFDLARLELVGSPVAVQEGVMRCIPCAGGAQYAFSDSGALVYIPGIADPGDLSMVWVGRDGKEELLPAPARSYSTPRVSPDGRYVAMTGPPSGIWIYDLGRGTLTRLNSDGFNPAWTSDSKRVAFQTNVQGKVNLFWQSADGSAGAERLATSDSRQSAGSFSRDGQLLAFNETGLTTGADIFIMRLGDRKAEPFFQAPSDQGAAKFSPDGRWIAYVSDETGQREIYVQPYPGPGAKSQISIDGGAEPAWSPNGRELFYRNGDRMLAVDITTQPAFSAGKPKLIFEGRYRRAGGQLPNYDVAADGRFLMLKPHDQPATQFNVVLNWFEELKEKVPAGKQ